MSRQKFQYIRSPRLLQACRRIPCQHCGRDDGTVVAAHSNWAVHGKGRSIKANDIYVASLCHKCHFLVLDQGCRLDRLERQEMWWGAHVKTVALLVARALWPDGVDVPDIENCPFELEGA